MLGITLILREGIQLHSVVNIYLTLLPQFSVLIVPCRPKLRVRIDFLIYDPPALLPIQS